jgi:hypothetical protein
VYKSLLKFVRGGGRNCDNHRRSAYRAGIENPFALTEDDILAQIKVGQQHCTYYHQHGKVYRKRHLKERLEVAREEEDEEAERQILGIIKREREQAFWRRLKYTMKKQTGGSVQLVQVEDEDGNIEEFTMQEEVHEAIWSHIHQKHFFLAEEAPICHSLLWETFGYNADSLAGDDRLEGSYIYENDFEEYTQDIRQEVARIREVILERLVDEIVWGSDWGKFWSRAREETSSSESGLHFGHYKAGGRSVVISHFHVMKESLKDVFRK